ncbi:hypothetical protein HY450_01795 [Candidatus Pacearchaeota archaeon]|nr:hypothetical protein [Candidatus Pacearchaeota archaeon]
MTILAKQPVAMSEVKVIVDKIEEAHQLQQYLKKFTKLNEKKAEELSKEIEKLGNHKIKTENIVKIVDFLPRDAEELNKVFSDVSLNEEETNAILEIVKRY